MRFSTAYYLFLIYLTVVFQPLIPIICDAVDHTFEDAVHVATVHAKYGANHVELELASYGSDKNNKDHNAVRTEEMVQSHFAEDEYSINLPATNIYTKYFMSSFLNLSHVFISKQSPPPKYFPNQTC